MINTVPIFNLNYTNQDYGSLKSRLLELIKVNFNKEFNDYSESSLAIVLTEVYSALADMLSFKIDQLANEFFPDTVTELDNMFRLCKLVGFRPLPPLPARAMFAAKITSPYSSDITIRAPILVSLDDLGYDVPYELFPADINNNPIDDYVVIPAGSLFTTAIVGLEGKTRNASFNSKGTPNQLFTIVNENVFYGSIRVFVDNNLWQEVEAFTEYSPMPEYRIEYDAYYKPSVMFGNNKAGLVPINGAKINIKYRVAGNSTSEIVSGVFNTKLSISLPGVSHPVIVHVTNYTKSEYGYPGDSINDIRKKLPAYLRTQNRAVTGADYKYITDSFASSSNGVIGKSNILLRNHGCAGNIIDIVVLAKTGEHRLVKASDNLKKELIDAVNEKKMFTDYICVKDGDVIPVDVNVDVTVDNIYKKYENEIRTRVVSKLEEFFELVNWEFGKSLKEKDIIKALIGIKEIKGVDVSFITPRSFDDEEVNNIIKVKYNEIVRPDNISVNFAYSSGE
jgi:hypothetical protein